MTEAIVFIPLTQGKVAVIDFEDFDERVRPYKWCANKAKNGFYAIHGRRTSDGPGPTQISLHRVVTNCPEGLEPDHKDGDGLNNRRNNLRLVKHQGLGFLSKPEGCSSKFRGVIWRKDLQKWQTAVRFNGQLIHIGFFSSESDAASAYNKKAIELGFAKEALNPV